MAANKTTAVEFGVIFFLAIIGLTIRITPALQASFPLNDGGLFYAMIMNLQEAHYALPLYATYNLAQIPFAYPPLAFYITGSLSDLLQISVLDLVRLLPPFVSTLAIPAFFLLAREITESKLQIIFGVFAFAFLPRVFAWHIMGGGITRSLGFLFAILTMTSAYRFYSRHTTRHLLYTILLGTLTVTTHPEAALHTAITALVFYLWKDRTLKGALLSLGIAAGILTLTSPWWGLVISHHGVDPFLASVSAAGQDSFNAMIGLIIFFRFLFTEEAYLQIIAMLGLIGLFAMLSRKQTFLPFWMFILHLIEPRGGALYMMIPLALLAGYAIDAVILPALNTTAETIKEKLGGKVSRYLLAFVFLYSLFTAYNVGWDIYRDKTLQPIDLEAFEWVGENTPADSQFVLITGQLPLRDAWSEWFPVLAERRSQASVFGYEWVNDDQFGARVDAYDSLQACAYQDADCLDEWSRSTGTSFSYVYIWNRSDSMRYPLSIYLQQKTEYQLVYQNKETLIFLKEN